MPLPIPKFIKGKTAGYDKKSRRYRWSDGSFTSKRQFRVGPVSSLEEGGEVGRLITRSPFQTPSTRAFNEIETLIGGVRDDEAIFDRAQMAVDKAVGDPSDRNLMTAAERLESVIAYSAPPSEQKAQPIPSDVLAMMRLSDFYCRTEGDVFQHISAPIDISLNPLDIQCPDDEGVKKELEDLYHNLDIEGVLAQIWQCIAQYGSAYPLEVYPKADIVDTLPQAILMLPPKYMWVGYYMAWGTQLGPKETSPYRVRPFDDSGAWSQELYENSFMPMSYNSFGSNWNEQLTQGFNIPLNPKFLRPVRAKALQFVRYPWPDLARAYRSISTRFVFEEVMRATVEGYRNQLWVFNLLKDGDHTPTKPELDRLEAQLSGMAGKRTGMLAWRGSKLEVNQYTPKPLDDMLSNESWQQFTVRIYRQMGGNARIVTGNSFMGERGDTGLEIDLSIFLKRNEHMRQSLLKWEYGFRKTLSEAKNSEAWDKAMEKTIVRFSRSLLETGDLIKKELQPLYQMGLADRRNTLEKSGWNYDQVLANKKAEKKDTDLFMPAPTFAQTTVNPGTPSKTASSTSNGRPTDVTSPKVKAATVENEPQKRQLFAEVYAAFRFLLEDGDVAKFIDSLRASLEIDLPQMAQTSFAASGGVGDINANVAGRAADFVTSFLPGLQAAMSISKDLPSFERRVLMYPEEGSKMAFIHGIQAAMAERGANYWRRVLHPSGTGPCPYCVADSQIVHPISEPFVALHPNENCDMQDLHIQFFSGEGNIPSVEMGVPNMTENEWNDLVGQLGKQGNPKIRRRRA